MPNIRRHAWAGTGKVLLGLLCASLAAASERMRPAPANIQAVLLVKSLAYNEDVTAGGELTIYVFGSPSIAQALQSGVGKSIGKATLADIQSLSQIPKKPPAKPAVFYIGNAKQSKAASAYCRTHKIMSVGGQPELAKKGVTLTIVVDGNKPKLLLDTKNAKKESLKLAPPLLKLAKTI